MTKLEFKEIVLDNGIASQYWEYFTCDTKYLMEKHNHYLRFVVVTDKEKAIGFCVINKDDNFFFPGSTIIQYYINNEYYKDSSKLILDLIKHFGVTKAVVSTEERDIFPAFLETKLDYEIVAYGFESDKIKETRNTKVGCIIEKATLDDWESIKGIWLSIYQKYKINPDNCKEEMERTRHQLENGDVYIIKTDNTVIGFGNLNLHYSTNGKAEIGYAINAEYWKMGYATRIAEYLKNECESKGMLAIAHCNYPHPASERVLQKIGMRALNRVIEFNVKEEDAK